MKRAIEPSNEAPAAKRTRSWNNEIGHLEGGSNAGLDPNSGSDGVDSHVVENSLVGGLQASGSWNGGSASDAPPDGGGGVRALSPSCGSDGVIDFGGLGGADDAANDLGFVFSDLLETDTTECMASLQNNPLMDSSDVDMTTDPGESSVMGGSLEGRSDVGDMSGKLVDGSDGAMGSDVITVGGIDGYLEGGSNPCTDLDDGSDGVNSRVFSKPLVEGLRASGRWDDCMPSDALPGGGGGVRALPGLDDDGGKDGSWRGINPGENDLSVSRGCLSPTPCQMEGGPDSLWSSDEQAFLNDMFGDPSWSNGPLASPNSFDFGSLGDAGCNRGPFEGANGVGGIGESFENGCDTDLGGSGVVSTAEFAGVGDSDDRFLNDGSDGTIGAHDVEGDRIGDDYQAVIPDLMNHVGSSEFNLSATGFVSTADPGESGNNDRLLNDGSDGTIGAHDVGGVRIGDEYQAVIPDLMYHVGSRSPENPCRESPLKVWEPGVVPENVLRFAFPQPRRNGSGSADLEQNMVSAFMIAKAGTNPLIGRRVSKQFHASPTEEASRGKSLAVLSNALRKGYVVRMDKIGDDDMFTVRFPRNSYFPEETEVVNIGELESMLVEGWASDEERCIITTEDTPQG